MRAIHAACVWQLALVGLVCATPGWTYDINTHQEISQKAFEQSVVSTYLPLGVDVTNALEGSADPLANFITLTPVQWVRRGAKDEDDTPRYLNHFYNPLDGGGYHYPGAPCFPFLGTMGCLPSPSWGIEIEPISGQDFSFTDARGYFYTALTAPDPKDREHALARTFLTLGHVMHLIQDAAQPQHTRNDSHGPGPFGGRSLYEKYTEQHTACLPLDDYAPVYGDGDTTAFNFIYDYWHRFGGQGLADYSNRGFVSARTNFTALPQAQPLTGYAIVPHEGFPLPSGQDAIVWSAQIEHLWPTDCGASPPAGLTGEVDFVSTPVRDVYRPELSERNNFTSTYSVFDPDLQKDGQPLAFTLNRYNFEAAWKFLIPRAVGYSAGLLNYFFRGAFSVYATDYDAGHYVVANHTAEPMNGTFQLYYDDASGNRQPVGGAQHIAVAASMPGEPYSTSPFQFAFSRDPTISDYSVVFQGTLGVENGAVAGTQTQVASAPMVQIIDLESGGVASDPQNDLASYRWKSGCWKNLGDGTVLLCPLPQCDAFGGASGGQASVAAPADCGVDLPTMCDECCVTLCATDSQGHEGCSDPLCFPTR